MSLSEDDLKRMADRMRQTINTIGTDDFEGYSPGEMQEIIYHPLSDRCPVHVMEATEDLYQQIPILNQARYLLSWIAEAGKVKLTITGKLPVSLVADIYDQGFMKDRLIESRIHKLYKEEDSHSIHLTHILLQLTKCVRKSKGYLLLSKKGAILENQPGELLKELLLAFGQKFNWSYFDGYGNQPIGSIGWLFSIYLVIKYGRETRPVQFYAEKYFLAFPALMQMIESGNPLSCYSLRTFDRFMVLFGLVSVRKEADWDLAQEIESTSTLYNLFKVLPPQNQQKKELN